MMTQFLKISEKIFTFNIKYNYLNSLRYYPSVNIQFGAFDAGWKFAEKNGLAQKRFSSMLSI